MKTIVSVCLLIGSSAMASSAPDFSTLGALACTESRKQNELISISEETAKGSGKSRRTITAKGKTADVLCDEDQKLLSCVYGNHLITLYKKDIMQDTASKQLFIFGFKDNYSNVNCQIIAK